MIITSSADHLRALKEYKCVLRAKDANSLGYFSEETGEEVAYMHPLAEQPELWEKARLNKDQLPLGATLEAINTTFD